MAPPEPGDGWVSGSSSYRRPLSGPNFSWFGPGPPSRSADQHRPPPAGSGLTRPLHSWPALSFCFIGWLYAGGSTNLTDRNAVENRCQTSWANLHPGSIVLV